MSKEKEEEKVENILLVTKTINADKWKSVDNPQSIHKAISIAIYR